MDNTLTITRGNIDSHLMLKLQGRLDGNNAAYLDDKLTELIQEGYDRVSLDMEEIAFLSSAGIRILVKQHKAFRHISGELCIARYSENVRIVLDMVGMTNLFAVDETEHSSIQGTADKDLKRFGYHFGQTSLEGNLAVLTRIGNPGKITESTYTQEDSHVLRLDTPAFSIGIGAFGQDFKDCRSRYGEYVALGDNIAFLPSDATKAPDYMIRVKNLIPEINILYGVSINECFQHEIRFTAESEPSITIGNIAEAVSEMGHHTNFAMLIIAESNGLVGASIKISPALGIPPFSYPDVRERVRFTTEPAHLNTLAITFGIFSKNPDDTLKPFLRPLNATGKLMAHIHSVVFPYTPLKKEHLDYKVVIDTLFNNAEILDVMHLLNDNRDISGIGESTFRSGHCWTTELVL